eukprot:1854080-Rhodomonas_salina.1
MSGPDIASRTRTGQHEAGVPRRLGVNSRRRGKCGSWILSCSSPPHSDAAAASQRSKKAKILVQVSIMRGHGLGKWGFVQLTKRLRPLAETVTIFQEIAKTLKTGIFGASLSEMFQPFPQRVYSTFEQGEQRKAHTRPSETETLVKTKREEGESEISSEQCRAGVRCQRVRLALCS